MMVTTLSGPLWISTTGVLCKLLDSLQILSNRGPAISNGTTRLQSILPTDPLFSV